jgi:hypothetical protein
MAETTIKARWCMASVTAGSAEKRAAMGSTLLRGSSETRPNIYAAKLARWRQSHK